LCHFKSTLRIRERQARRFEIALLRPSIALDPFLGLARVLQARAEGVDCHTYPVDPLRLLVAVSLGLA
jgi:hypothetical protein